MTTASHNASDDDAPLGTFHRSIDRTPLNQVEARRGSIMQSPYMFKELPGPVLHLKAFVRDVRTMLREDVPALIVEVKQLRQENKRLEARLDALENSRSETAPPTSNS